MIEEESTALVPIDEALPELSAEQYVQVREWDAARMMLKGNYEAADGEYLRKIRDVLKEAGHGLWTRYLRARGIEERTARKRIQVAEGRFVPWKPELSSVLHNPAPASLPTPTPTPEPATAWPTMPAGEAADETLKARAWDAAGERERDHEWLADHGNELADPEPQDEYDEDVPLAIAPYTPWLEPLPEPVPTQREIATSIAEYREETSEWKSAQFLHHLTRVVAEYQQVTDEQVAAFLEVSPAIHWPIALDMLARVREFCDHAAQMITDHGRPGLRAIK